MHFHWALTMDPSLYIKDRIRVKSMVTRISLVPNLLLISRVTLGKLSFFFLNTHLLCTQRAAYLGFVCLHPLLETSDNNSIYFKGLSWWLIEIVHVKWLNTVPGVPGRHCRVWSAKQWTVSHRPVWSWDWELSGSVHWCCWSCDECVGQWLCAMSLISLTPSYHSRDSL